MAYTTIELPGVKYDKQDAHSSTWRHASFQGIQITGREDEPIIITVMFRNYNTEPEDEDRGMAPYFKLVFSGIFEYRFIVEHKSYEDINVHRSDWKHGLIEIIPSEYIENMAAKGMLGSCANGQRFGFDDEAPDYGGIPESEVRHFRLTLHEWGKLDVIALNLLIEPAVSG